MNELADTELSDTSGSDFRASGPPFDYFQQFQRSSAHENLTSLRFIPDFLDAEFWFQTPAASNSPATRGKVPSIQSRRSGATLPVKAVVLRGRRSDGRANVSVTVVQ